MLNPGVQERFDTLNITNPSVGPLLLGAGATLTLRRLFLGDTLLADGIYTAASPGVSSWLFGTGTLFITSFYPIITTSIPYGAPVIATRDRTLTLGVSFSQPIAIDTSNAVALVKITRLGGTTVILGAATLLASVSTTSTSLM